MYSKSLFRQTERFPAGHDAYFDQRFLCRERTNTRRSMAPANWRDHSEGQANPAQLVSSLL
jgi:hypothetical protein